MLLKPRSHKLNQNFKGITLRVKLGPVQACHTVKSVMNMVMLYSASSTVKAKRVFISALLITNAME